MAPQIRVGSEYSSERTVIGRNVLHRTSGPSSNFNGIEKARLELEAQNQEKERERLLDLAAGEGYPKEEQSKRIRLSSRGQINDYLNIIGLGYVAKELADALKQSKFDVNAFLRKTAEMQNYRKQIQTAERLKIDLPRIINTQLKEKGLPPLHDDDFKKIFEIIEIGMLNQEELSNFDTWKQNKEKTEGEMNEEDEEEQLRAEIQARIDEMNKEKDKILNLFPSDDNGLPDTGINGLPKGLDDIKIPTAMQTDQNEGTSSSSTEETPQLEQEPEQQILPPPSGSSQPAPRSQTKAEKLRKSIVEYDEAIEKVQDAITKETVLLQITALQIEMKNLIIEKRKEEKELAEITGEPVQNEEQTLTSSTKKRGRKSEESSGGRGSEAPEGLIRRGKRNRTPVIRLNLKKLGGP